MTELVVVDSSVAYKWLQSLGENYVDEALDLLMQHRAGTITLVAPATLHVELANALRYCKRLTAEAVQTLVEKLPSLGIELVEPTVERISAATTLAYQHKMTVYDALFLQLAEEFACPLVTADRRAFAHIDTPVEIRLI